MLVRTTGGSELAAGECLRSPGGEWLWERTGESLLDSR